MSPTGKAVAGFTLIELMVTLAIAGLLLALVPPLLDKGGDRARLNHDRSAVIEQLRMARSRAIVEDHPVRLLIDVGHGRFGVESASQSFGRGITVTVETAAEDPGAIRFYADGSASGGEITLRNPAGESRLRIDWLTGLVE